MWRTIVNADVCMAVYIILTVWVSCEEKIGHFFTKINWLPSFSERKVFLNHSNTSKNKRPSQPLPSISITLSAPDIAVRCVLNVLLIIEILTAVFSPLRGVIFLMSMQVTPSRGCAVEPASWRPTSGAPRSSPSSPAMER